MANEELEAYMGMPAIYAVCEAIRTWLGDNNVKGLDDVSMHAQMMRKQMEAEKSKVGPTHVHDIDFYLYSCVLCASKMGIGWFTLEMCDLKNSRFIHHKHWISAFI